MPFYSSDDLVRKEPMAGFVGRFAAGTSMTSVTWSIAAGAELPEHAHEHVQVSHVLEGKFEMTVAGETQLLGPGTVAFVPSNATHSGRAITSCRIIDVFHPVRDDYR